MNLSDLGMWTDWQDRVKAALPNFAANTIYVEQDSVPEVRYCDLAETISKRPIIDPAGKIRDAEFGARVILTCLGPVTRMWLESEVEIDFLKRNFPSLPQLKAIDIGAGYGRLAVPLSSIVSEMSCVDAVPISTEISREYLARFAPKVRVLSLPEFEAGYKDLKIDLAINIHSFNECKLSQIENWLNVLGEMKVPYLFTVSHGQLDHYPEPSYRSWGDDHPSWRYLLEERYTLLAEESLGLSPNPHALWRRK